MSLPPDNVALPPRFRQEFCPKCDYSLEGLSDGAVCPECGFQVDPNFIVLRGKLLGTEKSLVRGSTSEFIFMNVLLLGVAWYMFTLTGGARIAFGIILPMTLLAVFYRIWNPDANKALLWIHDSGIVQTGTHDGFWKHPLVLSLLPLVGMVFPLSMMRWSSWYLGVVVVVVFLVSISPGLVDQLNARAARVRHNRLDLPDTFPWSLFKYVQFKFVAANRWQIRAVMASRLAAPSLVSIEVNGRDELMVALRERVRRLAPTLDIRG